MTEKVLVSTEMRAGETGHVERAARSSWDFFGALSYQLTIPTPDAYVPCNPCPLWIDGALACVVRAVDYRLGTPCTKSSSINYLAYLDDRMGLVTSCVRIRDESILPRNPDARVSGFEDMRLFVDEDGCLSALATACDVRHGGMPEMCKLGLDRAGVIEQAQVIRGPWSRFPQKNWTPIADDPSRVIYRMFPTCVISYDEIEITGRQWLGGTVLAVDDEHDFISSSIRGSSQAVPMDGGYLVIVHEHKTKRPLSYVHRFLWLDRNLVVKKVSKEFTWQGGGVEFCCGMTSKDGEEFIAGYGVNDSSAYIATFTAADVRKILQSL